MVSEVSNTLVYIVYTLYACVRVQGGGGGGVVKTSIEVKKSIRIILIPMLEVLLQSCCRK